MRWLRPPAPHDPSDKGFETVEAVEAVEEVAAQLTAAAHEAPLSHRAEEIRTALLDDLATDRGRLPGLAPLALAAGALLLALALGVGAPAVGSFIGDLIDRASPTDEVPSGPDATDADVREVPMPTDADTPARRSPPPTVRPSDSAQGGDDGAGSGGGSDAPLETAPATPEPAGTTPPTPSPQPASTPTAPPSGPPSDPPQPVPTPPPTAPPAGPPDG